MARSKVKPKEIADLAPDPTKFVAQIHILTAKLPLKNFPVGMTKPCLIQRMAPMWSYPPHPATPFIDPKSVGRIGIFYYHRSLDGKKGFYKVFDSMDQAKEFFEGISAW
jgi:hypothetical protein